MDEVVKLLEEYGLELDFIYNNRKEHLLDDLEHIQNKEKKEDAFEGFLDILGELMIAVKDYSKLYEKIKIPKRYKDVGSIVEKDVCIEIVRLSKVGFKTFFMDIGGEDVQVEYIKKVLQNTPEKVGVNNKELKIKSMYDPDNAIKNEIEKIRKLMIDLKKDRSIKEGLNNIAFEIKDILKGLEDDPNWYLEYGKRNEVFKKLLEEKNSSM